jgi:hypothetical protein
MHIEFIDKLRCPNAHEESSLVAAFYRMDGRMVVEGKLGCPICGAEFVIRDGVAVFREATAPQKPPKDGDQSDGTLIAALLDLSRPGLLVLLAGEWTRDSNAVAGLTSARIISLNAPSPGSRSDDVAEIRAAIPVPVVSHSLHGIALDSAHSESTMFAEAARLLRPRGRLVVQGETVLSQDFRELARERGLVVAEYLGDLVALRR